VVCDDIARIGVVAGMCGSRLRSSGVLPLWDMKSIVSFLWKLLAGRSVMRVVFVLFSSNKGEGFRTYISNVSQVSMRGFAGVHETRRHAHRLARRDEFLGDVGGFAHAGDDEFAAGLLALQDGFDS